ncbi:hypothetical protein F3J43_23070 [Pantoea sp. Cy-639]|nr:hypothetical protein [Pantoea sp. Cy-639]
MAAIISSEPRRSVLSISHLLSTMATVCAGDRSRLQWITKAKNAIGLYYQGHSRRLPDRGSHD